MAFIRCNIFPDGKRGKRTQLAGIQRDINWRSHGSGISSRVWETYHSKCVLFSSGQARHLFTLFSLRLLIQIFLSGFQRGKILLKLQKKKKEKKSRLDIGPTAVTSFSTVWALNISALIFDVLALFILILEEERSLFFFFFVKFRGLYMCFALNLYYFSPTPVRFIQIKKPFEFSNSGARLSPHIRLDKKKPQPVAADSE